MFHADDGRGILEKLSNREFLLGTIDRDQVSPAAPASFLGRGMCET